jgi:hypothetical protein
MKSNDTVQNRLVIPGTFSPLGVKRAIVTGYVQSFLISY